MAIDANTAQYDFFHSPLRFPLPPICLTGNASFQWNFAIASGAVILCGLIIGNKRPKSLVFMVAPGVVDPHLDTAAQTPSQVEATSFIGFLDWLTSSWRVCTFR